MNGLGLNTQKLFSMILKFLIKVGENGGKSLNFEKFSFFFNICRSFEHNQTTGHRKLLSSSALKTVRWVPDSTPSHNC